MPQLIPAPWFMIFLLSWTILLTTFKQKITTTTQYNLPTSLSQTMKKLESWTWTWS